MANKYAQKTADNSMSGGGSEKCPVGNHEAVIIAVYEFGSIYSAIDKKTKYMYRIVWEAENPENPEKPFIIGLNYNLSLYSESSLAKMLKGWKGAGFTEEELKTYGEDINILFNKIIGAGCQINVVEETTKSGVLWRKVFGVTSLKKDRWFTPKNTPTLYDITEDFPTNLEKQKQFKELPEWVLENMFEKHATMQKIYQDNNKQCPTAKAFMSGDSTPAPPANGAPIPQTELDNDVPF